MLPGIKRIIKQSYKIASAFLKTDNQFNDLKYQVLANRSYLKGR